MSRPVRIANVSGFYGDREHAVAEMLAGGDLDVITGDWLAELTMAILARTRSRRPEGGYAHSFIAEMRESLGEIVSRGVKVVVNAGGLDPLGCAAAVRAIARGQDIAVSVAAITGDDLIPRWDDLRSQGLEFANLQSGLPLSAPVLTANAYLGGWGIATALADGADVVVTGRVADASLVTGPAAWWHGWARDAWDALAGAVVAGHVIECGAQATGGNYSFFTEIPDLTHPGFPWAEIAEDGSSLIGKFDNFGGEVSVGTVTSQLLYEIDGPRYLNPDVTARFDTIQVGPAGRDRVRLSEVRGEPPPRDLKVAVTQPGGFANSMMVGLTGLDREAKARLVEAQIWDLSQWKPEDYEQVRTTLIGQSSPDPASNTDAITFLHLAVRDPDEEKVGRGWSNTVTQIALGSVPGLFAMWPPREAHTIARYWPTTIPRDVVGQIVHFVDREVAVAETPAESAPPLRPWDGPVESHPPPSRSETRRAPLGRLVGARSGDKGGNANLGVFTRTADGYAWLSWYLTVDRLGRLLPDLAGYAIDRHLFPNLNALNFVIHGLLDEGVASSLRVDPQAKGLGEYLRAVSADIPVELLDLPPGGTTRTGSSPQ